MVLSVDDCPLELFGDAAGVAMSIGRFRTYATVPLGFHGGDLLTATDYFFPACLCAFRLTFVSLRLMDRAEASGKTKVSHDCVRFFEALGVADTGKAQTLARLLQIFNDAAGKLDAQLASLGGHLHASVSRMCKPENLWAPPQHKSIRVVDRSGFFSDTDVHAYRVVNVGLSYAYRHKQLDALVSANTLRLSQQHHVLAGAGSLAQEPHEVLAGGVIVPRVPGSSLADGSTAAARGAPPTAQRHAGDVDETQNDDDGLLLPMGGLVVPRTGAGTAHGNASLPPGTSSGAGSGILGASDAPVGAGRVHEDPLVLDGGLVVARRAAGLHVTPGQPQPPPPVDDAVPPSCTLVGDDPSPLDSAPAPVVLDSKPVVTPNVTAVKCV